MLSRRPVAPSRGSIRASLGLAKAFAPLTGGLPCDPRSMKRAPMHPSPDEEAAIRAEFLRLTNLSQAELRAWLETGKSRRVGFVRRGEAESVGRPRGSA